MKKIVLGLMLTGIMFAGAFISDTRYTITQNQGLTINNVYDAQYAFQGDAPFYFSLDGGVPSESFRAMTTWNIVTIPSCYVPAGYNVRLNAPITTNIVIGVYGK